MNLPLRGSLRPRHDQMLDYAESLVDGKPTSVQVAGVIAKDQHAAHELRAMRSSLEVVAKAPELEPSEALTRAILLEARRMREPEQQRSRQYISAWRSFLQGTLFVSGLTASAVIVFGLALRSPAPAAPAAKAAPVATAPVAVSPDAISRTADEVQALSAAVRTGPTGAASPEGLQRLRAVSAVDSDLSAALIALERNPGSARATHIVHTSLQRQAESLREYYLDRSL